MRKTLETRRALVVICHFDGRPAGPLWALLDQMRRVPAGSEFDTLVVVNSVTGRTLTPPSDFRDVKILMRPNAGYNLGAWQAGWEASPDHSFYLFLQDDCFVLRPGWLAAFLRCADRARTGLVGESEVQTFTWRHVERGWMEVRVRYKALCKEVGVPDDMSPLHLQTVVVGARRDVLMRTGGFVTGDDKATAVAGEILTSVRMRHMGYINRQVGFFPYSYIGHPQHRKFAARARSLRWGASRCLRLAIARGMDATGRVLR